MLCHKFLRRLNTTSRYPNSAGRKEELLFTKNTVGTSKSRTAQAIRVMSQPALGCWFLVDPMSSDSMYMPSTGSTCGVVYSFRAGCLGSPLLALMPSSVVTCSFGVSLMITGIITAAQAYQETSPAVSVCLRPVPEVFFGLPQFNSADIAPI